MRIKMKLENIKAFLNTISLPVRLVAIINGKRDSFEFDGKNFPEGLEAVYTCDYVLDNPYHKENSMNTLIRFSPIISNDAKGEPQSEVIEAPRRGRPPKKVMEGNLD
jgi:hypothetical protein